MPRDRARRPGPPRSLAAPPPPELPKPDAIPGVIAAGQSWKVVWAWEGNNADGPLGNDDGTILFANNDAGNVLRLDPATGLASVAFDKLNTAGALSRSKNGALFVATRGLGGGIEQLEPSGGSLRHACSNRAPCLQLVVVHPHSLPCRRGPAGLAATSVAPVGNALVRVEVSGGIARVTLDSPENRNALSVRLVEDLHTALDRALQDDVRVVVLDHVPPAFCAGADVKEFRKVDSPILYRQDRVHNHWH